MFNKDVKNYYEVLLNKINSRRAIISVVGLGYVGLPLSYNFIKHKFKVIGIDNDKKKISSLKKGESYISSISNTKFKKIKFHSLTFNFNSISTSDIIIYCLPTPISNKKLPDLRILKKSIDKSKKFYKKGQLIILESTTYPGCTEDLFMPILKSLGFEIESNFFLSYSPEREDPGNKNFNLKNTIKVVSGYGYKSLELSSNLYKKSKVKIHKTSTLKTAEMTKLLENTYRNINIGFINEMKIICRKLDININEVIDSAKTKPFGFNAFYPGPGVGGHCIPVDPHYLLWKSKKVGINPKLIKHSSLVNDAMPKYIYSESCKILKKKFKKIKNIKILFIGLSYKKNINDLRESPSLELIKIFKEKNFKDLCFYDPFYKKIPITRKLNLQSINYLELNKKNIKYVDTIFLLTDHDSINYSLFDNFKSIIFDTRNKLNKNDNIMTI